ncbi:MAG TPA: hypothetical protein VHD91_05725 [Gaiellaceae bacterium]|nr:hypothetical protein [Gaiellaceae bacterium]
MNYEDTEFAVFAAAATCQATGRPSRIAGRLLDPEEVERALRRWQEIAGRAPTLHFMLDKPGTPIYEFTAD